MSLNNFVRSLQNIMRGDAGINGDAQRIEQMAWILFLKVYDSRESDWEIYEPEFKSIIPEELRWRNWAVDKKDGKSMTGQELLDFVNNKLFPGLRALTVTQDTPQNKAIVRSVFEDSNQYMKDGVLLRQVVNAIDTVDFNKYNELHAFGEIYETILKDLQSAGNAGEFYTPRAVTDFMVSRIAPKLGERVADFAAGTCGFLTSALDALISQAKTIEESDKYNRSVYGIEKKPMPYLLGITNLLLHGIDAPEFYHGNSLERNVRELDDSDKFDIILMNPPYGGTEQRIVQNNFPAEMRSSETADLFMALATYRLKKGGRAAVIIPDGFLFGTDAPKSAIKKRLLDDFNLHTIIRLPSSVFSPYTSITTNILFFENTGRTDRTWFYRVDIPKGYKHFSKTKPMLLEHFAECAAWWIDRHEIKDEGTDTFKSKAYSAEELSGRGYDFDLCGYPSKSEEVLSPGETIRAFRERRAQLNARIDRQLEEIAALLEVRSC